MTTKLLTLSTVLAATLFIGCDASSTSDVISEQPHMKKTREATLKDWTWEIDTEIELNNYTSYMVTHFYKDIPVKIKHWQTFIDTEPNKGFNGTDGWEVVGADYLIEDDKLYKSLSDTEWKWEYLGKIPSTDNKKTGEERAITTKNTSSTTSKLFRAIGESKRVNIFIEPYDVNWVGEYFTVPLPDVKIYKDGKIDENTTALTRTELDKLIADWRNTKDEKLKIAIENADVSKIKNMSNLFKRSYRYSNIEDLNLSKWDTSNVVDMNYMFYECGITTLPESFNTSNVIDMSGMFDRSEITSLPKSFDTSKVIDMSSMFEFSKISSLPESFDTSKVTEMKRMFFGSIIKTLPVSFDTSNVTNMRQMFFSSKTSSLPTTFTTSNVTNMEQMFRDSDFNQDITHWDVNKVTKWNEFNERSSLKDINIPIKFR